MRGRVVVAAIGLALVVADAAGAAPTWSTPTLLGAAAEEARAPQVSVASSGAATAAWSQIAGPIRRVEVRTRSADGTWGPSGPVSAAGRDTDDVHVATSADGVSTALWRQRDEQSWHVYAATREAGGAWSTPVGLTDDSGDAEELALGVGPGGEAVAVWSRPDAGDYRRIESSVRAAGGAWSTPVVISPADINAAHPRLAIGTDGAVAVVWDHTADDEVWASTRQAGADWGLPARVSPADVDVRNPQVAAGADGALAVTWRGSKPGDPLYVTTRSGSGDWTAPASIAGETGSVLQPRVALGSGGQVVVTWFALRTANGNFTAVTGTVGGASWSAPVDIGELGSILDSDRDGRDDDQPAASVGPDGAATVVWSEPGTDHSEVFTSSSVPGGAWSAPQPVSAGDRDAEHVQAAVSPAGDVLAVWRRRSESGWLVEAAVRDAAGPVLDDVSVPATGVVGVPVSLGVGPHDAWSGLGSTTWETGDGALAAGAHVDHVYGAPGTYEVRVTSTDALGNQTVATRTIAVAPVPAPTGGASGSRKTTVSACRPALQLVGAQPAGTRKRPRVRLTGVADRSQVGRRVAVRRDGRTVATVRVRKDGTIGASVRAPASSRARTTAKYRLVLGSRRSVARRSSRAAVVLRRASVSRQRVKITARVAGASAGRRLRVTTTSVCGGTTSAGTARVSRGGRLEVTVHRPTAAQQALVVRVRGTGVPAVFLPVVVTAP